LVFGSGGIVDAETQAVIDVARKMLDDVVECAWDVVNQVGHPGDTLSNVRQAGDAHRIGDLKAALQAHAQAHPPELPKKRSGPSRAYACPECDNMAEEVNCSYCGQAFLLGDGSSRLIGSKTSRPAPPPPSSPPNETTTKGPTLNDEGLHAEECAPSVMVGDVGMPNPPGYGPAPSPANPTILQLEKGDVCIFTCRSTMDCEKLERLREHWEKFSPEVVALIGDDKIPSIQVLRPAKGD
jgi:hypothetical protein